jgi:putative Mg2+ transporter-C (MgtC) family protein
MEPHLVRAVSGYWTNAAAIDNLIAVLNILGALLLGLAMGYERTWIGRAAGMRTFGFVCMASCALIVMMGHPDTWFGGHAPVESGGDPTRVVQGIVSGIGFLGAGVIMKNGFSIKGLTTAASIWTASVVGILVGIGFYPAAISTAFLSTVGMHVLKHIEDVLPSRRDMSVQIRLRGGATTWDDVIRAVGASGFCVAHETMTVSVAGDDREWSFICSSRIRLDHVAEVLSADLGSLPGLASLQISHARS